MPRGGVGESQLGDPDMRYSILGALGKTGSPLALPHLFAALAKGERGIRSCALDALEGSEQPEEPKSAHAAEAVHMRGHLVLLALDTDEHADGEGHRK